MKEEEKEFVTLKEFKEVVEVILSIEDALKQHRNAIEVLRKVNLNLSDRIKQLEIHNEIQGYLNEE
tara:strand:- start:811 stop:1008 length:198 start_codon:yes stop_codon:yes gene_type:complete